MKSVLRELYAGNITPGERRSPHSKEYLEVVYTIKDEERYFIEKMSLDDCQRFQRLSDLYSELISNDGENIFSSGFALGMMLMLDVMNEAEAL